MKKARRNLLARIDAEVAQTERWTGWRELSPAVKEAMASVPREAFVDPADRVSADDGPLPIGHGQTISQPFVVALMTQLIEPDADDVVLEIGTGCGYQTAVLASIVKRVYSVEVIPELAAGARARLQELGYENVEVSCGDGYAGWSAHAPFDAFLATAAAPYVPDSLIEQLRDGGRFVVPLGEEGGEQELVAGVKLGRGDVDARGVLPVAFVPMVHGEKA